ncbi:hypothetical protein [Actinacidiphila sp. bgisy160]|uniref:hypothetical protein n=1 Tax=Actinacidiphila sp. bgisy160 TaxID=3413796 RepID=UPI003D722AB2
MGTAVSAALEEQPRFTTAWQQAGSIGTARRRQEDQGDRTDAQEHGDLSPPRHRQPPIGTSA